MGPTSPLKWSAPIPILFPKSTSVVSDPKMESLRISFVVIFLISAVPRRSDGSFLRQLEQSTIHFADPAHLMSPSPSPLPLPSLNAPNPVTLLKELTCDNVSDKCDIQNYNLTACVPLAGNGARASYVVVQNGGEGSLPLNIVVRPANVTLKGLSIFGHQVMKVNLPSNTRGDSSIQLKVGAEECSINLRALIPQGSYTTYITPINATYLLFGAALFIGGSWACCNVVKRRDSRDRVSYQELQMEQQDSNGGWDQNWGDEWDDEEKAVISPGTIRTRKGSENDA